MESSISEDQYALQIPQVIEEEEEDLTPMNPRKKRTFGRRMRIKPGKVSKKRSKNILRRVGSLRNTTEDPNDNIIYKAY